MIKTREEIIESMCLTYRHDFHLEKDDRLVFSSGTTVEERNALRRTIGQIFDHDIAPYMTFKE